MKKHDTQMALSVLRSADWLRGYKPDLAGRLVAEGRLVKLSAGEWAQAEGDDRSGLFLVVAGLLHSYYARPDGKVIMLGFAAPGSVLGHATRYSGGPRLVTAVCAQDSTILEISEDALDRIAAHTPEIWRAIAELTYNNTRRALQLAAEVIALKPRQRIASRLVVMAAEYAGNGNPIINVNQELLGEMMGLTRKTVNRHLAEFEKASFVSVSYGKIEICNTAGLRSIVSG